MKKEVLVLGFSIFVLVACGSDKLNLDMDKVHKSVTDRALHHESKSSIYDPEDIEITKVCKAVRPDEEDFGFDGKYLVYWKTNDGELKDVYRMEDYKANLSISNLEVIDDSCVEFD